MRANMLDEINRAYVTTARAKGLSEFRLLMKYPVRLALNPFISTITWLLPNLVSGSIVVAIVLNLPTAAPLLLQSLMAQDMYLAGSFVLLICALTLSQSPGALPLIQFTPDAVSDARPRSSREPTTTCAVSGLISST